MSLPSGCLTCYNFPWCCRPCMPRRKSQNFYYREWNLCQSGTSLKRKIVKAMYADWLTEILEKVIRFAKMITCIHNAWTPLHVWQLYFIDIKDLFAQYDSAWDPTKFLTAYFNWQRFDIPEWQVGVSTHQFRKETINGLYLNKPQTIFWKWICTT